MELDVIFTAPHPDDIEILCGGAVAKLAAAGYRVGLVHLTSGEPTPRGSPEIRAKEAAAAADVLGATVCEILDLPNRELMDTPASRYALATVLRRYRPGVLVGIAGKTVQASPDHWQAQLITEAACFYARLTKWDDRFGGTSPHSIDHLVYRPVPRSLRSEPWPGQFVVDITEVMDKKLAAVACYKSQFDGERAERIAHHIRSTAGQEGAWAGFRFGELYALARPLATGDMMALLEGRRSPARPDRT